jgi:hypothetical protein
MSEAYNLLSFKRTFPMLGRTWEYELADGTEVDVTFGYAVVLAHLGGRLDECETEEDVCEAAREAEWLAGMGILDGDLDEDGVEQEVDRFFNSRCNAVVPDCLRHD